MKISIYPPSKKATILFEMPSVGLTVFPLLFISLIDLAFPHKALVLVSYLFFRKE